MKTLHRTSTALLGLLLLFNQLQPSEGFLFQRLFGFGLIDGLLNGKFTCMISYLSIGGFDLAARDQFETFFRDDSVFTLAQTGSYYGVDGIKEYVDYIYNTTSDYFAWGGERLDTDSEILGLDDEGQCLFRSALHSKYILNATVTETDDTFEVTSMVKLTLQPSG